MSDEDVIVASAAFLCTKLALKKQKSKTKKRLLWQRAIFNSRPRYNGSDLLCFYTQLCNNIKINVTSNIGIFKHYHEHNCVVYLLYILLVFF